MFKKHPLDTTQYREEQQAVERLGKPVEELTDAELVEELTTPTEAEIQLQSDVVAQALRNPRELPGFAKLLDDYVRAHVATLTAHQVWGGDGNELLREKQARAKLFGYVSTALNQLARR